MDRRLILALLIATAPALGASKKEGNCKVELTKQASSGSIFISFDAADESECAQASASDISTVYSGPRGGQAAPKAPPMRKKLIPDPPTDL